MKQNPQFSVENNPPRVFAHLQDANSATSAPESSATSAAKNANGKTTNSKTANNKTIELHPLWLRERCQDAKHRDPHTQQRVFDSHQLPENLELVEARSQNNAEIFLAFSDGYKGTYKTNEFISDFDDYDGCPVPESWNATINPLPAVSWKEIDSDDSLLEALKKFLTYGFIIVKDTPTEKDSILEIASRFGFVRETNFGNFFEVYSRPLANDLAYTARALFPHTDNPYRDPVPGIQLLHCLINETSGGLSTLVDSMEIANIVREEDPEGFQLLTTIPIRYRFIDKDSELIDRNTLISLDNAGEVSGIHYNSKVDFLPPLANEKTIVYHRARKRLISLFKDARFELQFLLQKGELMMFDNNRVLHGRTAFNPNEGRRQLQGCYIDRDAPRSLYRVLNRRTTNNG